MTETKPLRGFSIRIYVADGTPEGLRLVEKSNWTGRAIVCPRSQFPQAKARPEFGKTGLYILLGPPTSGDSPSLYIGECDPLRPRLENHYANKDFWTDVIAFISKDENLNKAHVQYLEARLVQLAREAKRCTLENTVTPSPPSLSEPDIAEMDSFLEEMLLIYPVLGLKAFEKPQAEPDTGPKLRLEGKGVTAFGYESSAGFVVLEGSQAVITTVPSVHHYLVNLRTSLAEKAILIPDGDHFRLTQDYTFDSPSTAAGVLLGRSANGRIEWKDGEGRTLREIQEVAIQDK